MATVLVVEDEDVTRLMLETRLHIAGHHVLAAASMDEALESMEGAFVPDVVVTDMFMPGGSGLSLVAGLRGDPDRADVPVIFLSGRALPGDVAAGEALGATYLTKPVSVDDLQRAIEAALEASAASRGEAVRERLTDLAGLDDEGERALYARLLAEFVARGPELAGAVLDALADDDATALEAAAHKLRGAAATLGAEPLAALCGRLEEAALAGHVPAAAASTAALQREMAVTCRVFADLSAELGAADEATALAGVAAG